MGCASALPGLFRILAYLAGILSQPLGITSTHYHTMTVKEGNMSNEEWIAHTAEWKRGWRYGQGDDTIQVENSEEFKAGYRYAIDHPFGPVAVPM